jgi:hypothetical protein
MDSTLKADQQPKDFQSRQEGFLAQLMIVKDLL